MQHQKTIKQPPNSNQIWYQPVDVGQRSLFGPQIPDFCNFGRWKRRPGGAGERIAADTTKIISNHTHNNGYDIWEQIFLGNIAQNIDDIVGYWWQKNAILVAGNCAFWWVDFDRYSRTSQVKGTGQVNESILSFHICILYALARGIGGSVAVMVVDKFCVLLVTSA